MHSCGIIEALTYHIPSGMELRAKDSAEIILLVEIEVH